MNDVISKPVIVRDYYLKAEELKSLYLDSEIKTTAPYSDLLAVVDKNFFLISHILESPVFTKNQDVLDVLQMLLSRGMKTFRSVRVLLGHGCDQDAVALLRNLIETAMTIKYMARGNLQSLAQRFRKYQVVEKKKNIKKHRGFDKSWLPPGGEVELKKIEVEFQSYKDKYEDKENRKNKNWKSQWHGLGGIESLAKEADMENDYIQAFSVYCLLTHPSFLSVKEYASDGTKSGYPSWAPTARRSVELACLATGYMLKIVESYTALLGIDSDDISNVLTEVQANLLALDQVNLNPRK